MTMRDPTLKRRNDCLMSLRDALFSFLTLAAIVFEVKRLAWLYKCGPGLPRACN
jgi:hypothetical protein